MRKVVILLLMLLPMASMNAQIIKKSNKDKIGQDIKEGFNNALKTIKQDAHPTGEHNLWDGYVGPKLGVGISSMPGAGGLPEVGVVGGGFFDVFVAKNLSLSFELLYQHQGGNHLHHTEMIDVPDAQGVGSQQVADRGSYNYNLDYINTAYLIHWYPWSYRPVSFYTGLQMMRMVNASCRRKGGSKVNIEDDLFNGEFDIPVGATYEWKQWQLDARYYISPRKLAGSKRAKQIIGNARNMMLSVTIAYRIQIF